MNPVEFLETAREQLKPYGVEYRRIGVTSVEKTDDGFRAVLADSAEVASRKLVLATGVIDRVPQIDGIEQFYGKSVHHCPYCDGWEHRGQSIAVYGRGKSAYLLAREMLVWSRNIAIVSDGPSELTGEQQQELARLLVTVHENGVLRLEGTGEKLERILFDGGAQLPCQAIFFCTGQDQRCDLPDKLGCVFNRKGTVDTDRWERSNVPGVYVIGDASKNVQFVVVAAAEGAIAAQRINADLAAEDITRMLS